MSDTQEPQMPEPLRNVRAAPPFAVFDEFGNGCDDKVADHVRAYAEALAAHRVAQERERWRELVGQLIWARETLTATQPPEDNRLLLMKAFEAVHKRSAPIPPDINAVLHANLSELYIEGEQPPGEGKES